MIYRQIKGGFPYKSPIKHSEITIIYKEILGGSPYVCL